MRGSAVAKVGFWTTSTSEKIGVRQTHTSRWERTAAGAGNFPPAGVGRRSGVKGMTAEPHMSGSTDPTSGSSCDFNQLLCSGALACKAIPRHAALTGESNQKNLVPPHPPPPRWPLRSLRVSTLNQVCSDPVSLCKCWRQDDVNTSMN